MRAEAELFAGRAGKRRFQISDARPEAEVGSANASNNFSPDFIEDFNDVPSNQDDFDQSTIDPSGRPSKKIRCKKYPANIELAQRKLALQARFSVDGSKLMMEELQWSGSTSLRSSKFRTYKEPGSCIVDLHFAEIVFTDGPSGMRVFDVYIQEEKAVSSIDIYAQVGANKSLVIPDLPALVKDDKRLSVRLQGVIGNPMISGISVRKDLLRSSGEVEFPKVVGMSQLIDCESAKRKELAEVRRAIEELKRENQVKNKECQEAWSSLQELQNELMCKSMHIGSLDQGSHELTPVSSDKMFTTVATFDFIILCYLLCALPTHVFEDTAPFATSVLDGYNVCIFAAEL
ncbi:hypothetical protein Ancab_038050 [Ancistrocladus abbreviatus]